MQTANQIFENLNVRLFFFFEQQVSKNLLGFGSEFCIDWFCARKVQLDYFQHLLTLGFSKKELFISKAMVCNLPMIIMYEILIQDCIDFYSFITINKL